MLTLTIERTGVVLSMRTGSEGPAHDPYGYTEIIALVPGNNWVGPKTCVWRSGGLGYDRFTLNKRVIGEVFSGFGKAKAELLGLKHRWASHTGMSIAECERLLGDEMDFQDPMGNPSDYE